MVSAAVAPLNDALKAGWELLRHELLFVFWALMEVALVAPLFLALTPWTRFWSPALVTLWLVLIMLIPFNLSRFTSVLRVTIESQRIIMVLSLLLVLILSWRFLLYTPSPLFDFGWIVDMAGHLGDGVDPRWQRELSLFVVIALMWWRGIALAGRSVDYRNAGLRMRAGILLTLFLVAGFAGSQLEWSVAPFILLFLFASLVSVVLTRVEQLELSRSGRSFAIGPTWLATVLAVSGAVVFVTGIIAGFVSGESIGRVLGWFEPLWLALRFALAAVVSMISLLITPLLVLLVSFTEWFVGLIGGSTSPVVDLIQGLRESLQFKVEETAESTGTVRWDFHQVLTGLTLIFVILMVSLAVSRLYRMARPPAEPQRETVGPFDGLGRPGGLSLRERFLDQLGALRRRRAAASIRQTYRAMCKAAAARGFPRVESETPYEYLDSLEKAFPAMQVDTALITEAYTRAHYGELPDTDEELRQIVAAWERLESGDSTL